MRPLASVGLMTACIWLAGCGYPGDPLPPALNRPRVVTDLSAVERGSKIVIQFTMPTETTDGLPVRSGADVELRVGAAGGGKLDIPEWERTAERVGGKEVDAAKFYGKTVVIGVRVKGARGQSAGWSNFVALQIVPALATPEGLEAKNAPDAVQLNWHAAAPQFRLFRKLAEQKEWTELVTIAKPDYLDATIEYGKTYDYQVQALEKAGETFAESELSGGVQIRPVDTFAPAVPTGLNALPGTRTIELLWDRNTDKDLAEYRIYRDRMKLADRLQSPSYSDRDVKAGTRYSYQVTAVDNAGNESAPSAAVEALIP